MTTVDYVRPASGGRLAVRFETGRAVFFTSPLRWADWVRRFWWSIVACLALAWVGFLAHQLGAPREVATWFAAPGGVLFAGFVAYIVLSVLYAIVTLGFGKPVMSRFGNWIDRRAAPAAAAGIISAGVVVGVSAQRRFRRTVVRVLFINGSEVRYTRWGARRAGRDLTEGFRSLMSQAVPSGPHR